MVQKRNYSTITRRYSRVSLVILMAFVLLIGSQTGLFAQSLQQLQSESSEIVSEMESASEEVMQLREQAENLETAIEKLDEEIEESQKEIDRIAERVAELQDQLDETRIELEKKKTLLQANMRVLYKRSGATTFELLASTDNFSEFINEQDSLGRLKEAVQAATREVFDIERAIRAQQNEQTELLLQQESITASLAELREDRQELLDENIDEQDRLWEYTQSLAERQREINQEFIRMSHIVTTEGTGGYPWAEALCAYTDLSFGPCRHPTDSWGDFEWYVDEKSNRRDTWEFFYRNCTSYVAWRSAQDGFELTAPGPGRSLLGDAGSWHINAQKADGLTVGTEPKVGSFAVFASGPFGHVAYVEKITGDRVLISEYNLLADGMYSERWIPRYQPTAYVYTPYSR